MSHKGADQSPLPDYCSASLFRGSASPDRVTVLLCRSFLGRSGQEPCSNHALRSLTGWPVQSRVQCCRGNIRSTARRSTELQPVSRLFPRDMNLGLNFWVGVLEDDAAVQVTRVDLASTVIKSWKVTPIHYADIVRPSQAYADDLVTHTVRYCLEFRRNPCDLCGKSHSFECKITPRSTFVASSIGG
jgi:hypothetical protein